MEKLRRAVNQIAYTPTLSLLSPLQLALIPLLSFASSLYNLSLSFRRLLYRSGLLPKHRLGVPVISVGNLTWGGNGKTPMVEFIALWFSTSGISPLILTRGYGGADEARMLQRHLEGTSAKIGIGANRAVTATSFIEKYGSVNPRSIFFFERLCSHQNAQSHLHSQEIGVAILDDGMQHLSLWRDLEIVMVNGMMPWGNHQLLPLGPLREPLTSLTRAGIVVVHHADMMGPLYVDRLDFSDHHSFQMEDVNMIKTRLEKLRAKFASNPIVVVTEKDYDRDPKILKHLDLAFDVLVLCCKLEIIPHRGGVLSEDSFKRLSMQLLELNYHSS